MTQPTGIGVLGCGMVSRMYLPVLTAMPELEVVAVADVDSKRARNAAEEFGVPDVPSPEDLLADDRIELVVNLTPIASHVEVSKAALTAGKHVYSEKPLTTNPDDAKLLVDLAAERGLALACAPDTLLGSGFQAAQAALAANAIGRPLAATACMLRPELTRRSFYTRGATPIFDMAPYYLSALVQLFGPAVRVGGSTRTWPGEEPPPPADMGAPIAASGAIDFGSGVLATIVMAWGTVPVGEIPVLDVFGSEGVLRFPNPNNFGDPAFVRRHGETEWTEVAGSRQPGNRRRNLRGLGVGEMARALQAGREPRASGAVACHVVDLITGLVDSARTGEHITMTTTCTPAPAMPEHERETLLGNAGLAAG